MPAVRTGQHPHVSGAIGALQRWFPSIKKIEDTSFGLSVAEDFVDEQALFELAVAAIRRGVDRTHECACALAAEKPFTRRGSESQASATG